MNNGGYNLTGRQFGRLLTVLERAGSGRHGARRQRPENVLHRAVLAHLKARGVPGLFYFHVPSGAFFGSPRQGAIMKSLGWIAGLPDLMVLHKGRLFCLELKAEGGRATEKQFETIAAMEAAGAFTCIAEGLDRAIACLEGWGLLRGRSSAQHLTRNTNAAPARGDVRISRGQQARPSMANTRRTDRFDPVGPTTPPSGCAPARLRSNKR